jgi:L-alanine-DL-glutamate epimerase-like enolase superfamily enzyme
MTGSGACITDLQARVYRIPTDKPEADGTISWDATTVLVVETKSDRGEIGMGFSYCAAAAASVVCDVLAPIVTGSDVSQLQETWQHMLAAVRNIGRQGVAATAISAVDIALWDLRAKLENRPVVQVLGSAREAVPIYGSGGFTSYSDSELQAQLAGWVGAGIPRVKMKIGTDWGTQTHTDVHRVQLAREAIGADAELFVDANGAYNARQAVDLAQRFAEQQVSYFEEPVSSDHLDQLAFVRDHISMAVAAGEYGYDPWYFQTMLRAGAVDILQADVTRCLGVTGWLQAADLAYASAVPFSAHTAPSLHAHLGCAAPAIAHVEYFHDHARIERMLFDGAPQPVGGCLSPDRSRPGFGLELKDPDAEQWRIG